jgi:hypothetical protein
MKNLLIVTALVVLFASCSQVFPPTMYSPKAMNELTTDLKKISENYKIEKVRVFEKDKLSSEFGMACVQMRSNEGQKFEQILYYNYGIPHDDPKPKKEHGTKRTDPHPVNVEDIIKNIYTHAKSIYSSSQAHCYRKIFRCLGAGFGSRISHSGH